MSFDSLETTKVVFWSILYNNMDHTWGIVPPKSFERSSSDNANIATYSEKFLPQGTMSFNWNAIVYSSYDTVSLK